MKNTTISDLQNMALQATLAASQGRITKGHRLIYDVASINKKQTIRLYSCRDNYE